MAKARDVIVKPKAPRPCSVTALDGETKLDFGLRLLPACDTGEAVRSAKEYARANGVAAPAPDDAMYLRGLWLNTVLLSAVDIDAPDERYFEDVGQIARMLDDASVAYVHQAQRDYQNEYAPSPEGMNPEQFVALVAASTDEWQKGGDPERPFVGLPLSALRSFSAQLVLQCMMQTQLLSHAGLETESPTASSANSPNSANGSDAMG